MLSLISLKDPVTEARNMKRSTCVESAEKDELIMCTPVENAKLMTGEDSVDFCSFEHKCIGENIESRQAELKHLELPNGVQMTFGQIIALAGDFYGVPNRPIINPSKEINQTDSDRQQRFLAAYNTLARAPKEILQKEVNELITALDRERKKGSSIGNKEWDQITGGKWLGGLPIKHGRMLKLAEDNHDHFLPYAKDAYLTGHLLALNKAREASEYAGKESKRFLHEALSLDGFACHFLTDSFSSGHIRTPRVELGKETISSNVGHLLSKCMHDEDGKFGLRVINVRGDKWISYGDGILLHEKSKDNLKLAIEAVQLSVDQVYDAYRNPTKTLETTVLTDLIPFVDQEERNTNPLFRQVTDDKLCRRSSVNDPHDHRTVTSWWGATTLFQTVDFKKILIRSLSI